MVFLEWNGGVRKEEYYNKKVKDLTNKRSDIYNKKGAISNSYIKTSKNLLVAKAKRDYYHAKNTGTKADRIAEKENLKGAKSIKKYGTANMWGTRSIYGQKPTPNELQAINVKEVRKSNIKTKGKTATRIALSVVGPLVISVGIAEYKYKKFNGKFGVPSFAFKNGILQTIVK